MAAVKMFHMFIYQIISVINDKRVKMFDDGDSFIVVTVMSGSVVMVMSGSPSSR